MTLIAAFRCHRGGLLLCADREESDGNVKREVDKICRIQLPTFELFIAGSGPSSVVSASCLEIRSALIQAFADGKDMVKEHKPLIEATLQSIHARYAEHLKDWFLGLIVIFAPFDRSMAPLLYRTELSMMVSEPLYVGYGAGKALCDYLADRLYGDVYERLDDCTLVAVASFIFREVEHSVGGVGLGVDMMFIREGSPLGMKFGKHHVKAIQDQIPPLGDGIFSCWKDSVSIPADLIP